jgi:hypothetical protein
MTPIHVEPTLNPQDRLIPRSAPLVSINRSDPRPVGVLDDEVAASAYPEPEAPTP